MAAQTYLPKPVTDLDIAFGGSVTSLMPPYGSVTPTREWKDLQARWFFKGLPKETTFEPKPGIDPALAIRHLKAIQGSWEPKHEHKEQAVAFLLSEWFVSVNTGDRIYGGAK
jgi:hypothetical protein